MKSRPPACHFARARTCPKARNHGFTLVEIAVVLVIVGIILGGILNARSIKRNATVKDVARAVGDIATVAHQFRGRYGAWPGDLASASAVIPNVSAACNGNANQVIDPAEVACASEELIRSGMVRGDVTAVNPLVLNGTHVVRLVSRATAAALPGLATIPLGWGNVVHVQNRLDCDAVIQVDRLLDDGNPATGNFRAGTVCAGQDENTVVDNVVLRIN